MRVVAAGHEEGDHVVDVGFAALELVGGVVIVHADEEGFSAAGHLGRWFEAMVSGRGHVLCSSVCMNEEHKFGEGSCHNTIPTESSPPLIQCSDF